MTKHGFFATEGLPTKHVGLGREVNTNIKKKVSKISGVQGFFLHLAFHNQRGLNKDTIREEGNSGKSQLWSERTFT